MTIDDQDDKDTWDDWDDQNEQGGTLQLTFLYIHVQSYQGINILSEICSYSYTKWKQV